MKPDPGERSIKAAPLLFSCRLTLFIVFLFSTFSFVLQRINMSFALVCMVKRPNVTVTASKFDIFSNNSKILSFENGIEDKVENVAKHFLSNFIDYTVDDDFCKSLAETRLANTSSSSSSDIGEFEWSKEVQGAILGSFFYGYIFTQIFGGWLAQRFGAKLAFISSLACLCTLTLLNPIAARFGPKYMFAVRFLQGFTHGSVIPAMNIFSSRWCAPQERGFLMGIAYGGICIAAALTFPICAFLCQNFGWTSIFYATGGFGMLLTIIANFLIYEWPENHPRISHEELEFIRKTRSVSYTNSQNSKKIAVPWRKIILSGPINVVHITHTCFRWGFFMIGMYLPTYLREVLYMDVSKNGIYSSLPYWAMLSVHFLIGSIFDFFRKKNCCSVTILRKIFNTIGMVGPALSLIMTGFVSCENIELGIALVSVGQALGEFAFMGGYMLSIFELAPKYAGIIIGVTNTFGVLPGFLCPLFVSFLAPNGTREEWIVVFLIAAAFNIFGAVLYGIFGSCELQSWAKDTEIRKSSLRESIRQEDDTTNSQNQYKTDQEMVPLNKSHL